ncbi:MAG: GNAT family N-acetyltransferase [Bryobacterales bacterium]|nr:GNAT family N-acetyltransferase [Bryobacterales bacterium]
MPIEVRLCTLEEIVGLRGEYRIEMGCQIIHDSIHSRPGWTQEYAVVLEGAVVGYGSVAVSGPWRERPALYEFFVTRSQWGKLFTMFEALLSESGVAVVETQTNDRLLTAMLHTYCSEIHAEAVVFEDEFATLHRPAEAEIRAARGEDAEAIRRWELDEGASWVLTSNGIVAGAGDILCHYNPPYGDVYMKIAEPFRRRGLGAYLVQELKAICRARGKFPAARCHVNNVASRRTLQSAGFVPCANLVVGEVRPKDW